MPAPLTRDEPYRQALEFLNELQMFGARFGLENTRKLAALAGNPQNQIRFIHVAGTNGKGSTCAMLESIYRAAGVARVGLFTSPHLVSFRERLQVDREPISQAEVVRQVAQLKPLLRQFPADHPPTFFEVVTVMALCHFAEQRSELVIWEAGLGGRLDATNIVTPLASIITNIGMDHQAWLGDTLEKIAAEKAGIIKPRVPVVTAASGAALGVIEQVAAELHAPLIATGPSPGDPTPTPPPLPGEHQRQNAAVALATVEALQSWLPVSPAQLRQGLAQVHWPGRLQLVTRPSGQKLLLDGAHNADGAAALRAALDAAPPSAAPPALILGMLGDKDCREMCRLLAPWAARIWVVPVKSRRTADPSALAAMCRSENARARVVPAASLQEALTLAQHEPLVVIAGSLYLIGEALQWLELSPSSETDEKGLNDWTPPRDYKSW